MTYTTREDWLNAYIDHARPIFDRINAPLPLNVRVAVGFPSRGSRGKVLSECWDTGASADGHYEIFIAPTLTDVRDVCAALTYELIRAALGLEKGATAIRRLATSLGMTCAKQLTHGRGVSPGPGWDAWHTPLAAALGPMPYATLDARDGRSSARAKQKTYLHKAQCVVPGCGWTCQVTAKHYHAAPTLNCPVPDCIGILICETL